MKDIKDTQRTLVEIRPYTTKELAFLYSISIPTFKKWLKPFDAYIGKRHGNYYNVAQVKIIFEQLDHPFKMFID